MTATRNLNAPQNSHTIEFISLTDSSGNEYDIKNLVVTTTLYEDIRDNSIEGSLLMYDENHIINKLNITGGEQVDIKFTTVNNSGQTKGIYEKSFQIISAGILQRSKESKLDVYEFKIISKPYIENIKTKISKSYKDITNDELAIELMKQLNTDIEVTKCLYPRDIIVPNVTPFEFISRLTYESTSKESLSSDFVFFENADGYHFKSLYDLMQQDISFTFNHDIDNVTKRFDRFKVIQYTLIEPFNIMEQLDGALGSTIFTHDINNKLITKNSTDYYSYSDKFKRMNEELLYTNKEQSVDADITYDIGEAYYSINRDGKINQRLKRNMNHTLLNSTTASLYTAGNADVKLGQTIRYEMIDFDKADIRNSGKFIITKIKHELSKAEYHQTLEIKKDSNIK